jgi:hypothetical protein
VGFRSPFSLQFQWENENGKNGEIGKMGKIGKRKDLSKWENEGICRVLT